MWTYINAKRREKRNSKWIWTVIIKEGGKELITYEWEIGMKKPS